MSTPLPPGWTALQAPNGRWYFHNAANNTTQWQPPPPVPNPHSVPPQYHQSPPHGYPQPSGQPTSYPSGDIPPTTAQPGPSSPVGAAAARYTYNTPTSFKLKEKIFSLSGDAFQIKNVSTGTTAYKVKGNPFSFTDSKKLLDPSGDPIYTMTESILTLRGRMTIADSKTKQSVVTLRKKGFIPMMGTSTVLVWRGGSDEGEPWLQVKGDFFRKDFNFTDKTTGRVIATVSRKGFNMSNILFEKDSYVIRVEPGVDTALMVFLVVALDEQYRDDGNRTGYGSRLGGLF